MVDITDRKSAEAWLRVQSREVCVAMAMRTALRVIGSLGWVDQAILGRLVLPTFRATLSSALLGTWPNTDAREYELAIDTAREAQPIYAVEAAVDAAYAARSTIEDADSAGGAIAAAQNAADAAGAVAYAPFSMDAAGFDAGETPDQRFYNPVWLEVEEPPALSEARERLLAFLDAEPEVWGFWKRWYQGMFEGRPMGWDLQRRVALIPETVWQEGPASVAAEIARIEAAFGPITPQAAKAQANRLKERPVVAATAAKGLAAIIQMATDAYRREVCNALPEALEPLERLPGLLDTIAVKVISDCPEDELAQLVVMMAGTIAELNLRLRRAREEVKSRPVADEKRGRRSLIREGFYTNIGGMMSGALFSTALWGALFAGSQTLIGPAAADLVDGLGQCYEDMIGPEADTPPELWALPSLDA